MQAARIIPTLLLMALSAEPAIASGTKSTSQTPRRIIHSAHHQVPTPIGRARRKRIAVPPPSEQNDQDLYRREYVRRRAFPDTVLDFIPGAEVYKHLTDRLPPRAVAPRGSLGITERPCEWIPAGPTNVPGRVTGLAVTKLPASPGSPRVIATTVGGVWRSMDGGRHWERVSNAMKPGVFGAVGVTPHDPTEMNPVDEVFVGGGDPNHFDPSRAGGPGIWRSTSGGAAGSWQPEGPTDLVDAVIFGFQIAPKPPHNVYVATSRGVYLWDRAPGGAGWSRLQGFDAPTSDIAVAFPSGAGDPVVYAGVYKPDPPGTTSHEPGVWKFARSPSAGLQWKYKSEGFASYSSHIEAIRLGIAPGAGPSNGDVLYAKLTTREEVTIGSTTHPAYSLLGLYKTETGGETNTTGCSHPWCHVDVPDMNDSQLGDYYDWYNGAILIDPANPNTVFVGNRGLWWKEPTGPLWKLVSSLDIDIDILNHHGVLHDDVHALTYDPDDPKVVWVGTDGGVYRSPPQETSGTFAYWEPRAHGMTTTEFWGVGTQQAQVTPALGGTQDNGGAVTYGNRTWYAYYTCDGAQAGLDAANRATAYSSCNGDVEVIKTVVPGMPDDAWSSRDPATTWPEPQSPFAVDPGRAGHLVSAGLAEPGPSDDPVGIPCIVKTDDAHTWDLASTVTPADQATVPRDMQVWCIAMAPGAPPCAAAGSNPPSQVFYAGLISSDSDADQQETSIIHTTDGGQHWDPATSGVPVPPLSPNGIAVDRIDPNRAFAALGGQRGHAGQVAVTTNGGVDWHDLPFPAGWSPAPVTCVAIDPFDRSDSRSVIYVGTAIGVARGVVTLPAAAVVWEHFNQGLPKDLRISPPNEISVDITSIEVNACTGTLILGTLGYGSYQRDIRTGSQCPSALLTIRDNVFDRGEEPSPDSELDPEHPICLTPSSNPPSCDVYEPGGPLHWWDSPDIRVDTPCDIQMPGVLCTRDKLEPTGELDAVQVESCPTSVRDCDFRLMRDRNARRGMVNRVYVQVTNHGLDTAHHLRILALWADATAVVPPLPPDFWSTTFPASGGCSGLDESTGWHFLEPMPADTGCGHIKVIETLERGQSDIVHFDWQTPSSAPRHSCVMAMVECPDDPIPPSVRAGSTMPWVFVPNTHQIGQRNLYIDDAPGTMMQAAAFRDSTTFRNLIPGLGNQRLIISRPELGPSDTISILLPKRPGLTVANVDTIRAGMTPDERRAGSGLFDVDTTLVFRVRPPGGVIGGLTVTPFDRWHIGLRYALGPGKRARLAPRFVIVAMADSAVLGGSTYMVRYPR